ncbi:hypothetical protein H0H81_001518 [Sphagnurus paluster]|uniref:Uncharacterized protein n=1 Tax=Sphagnurus paluster TaxID=117069 RepID=A0A9P7GH35_9AGAR|nr:hypothetical protein H0H81_001518 [Sphagnurus paluster]
MAPATSEAATTSEAAFTTLPTAISSTAIHISSTIVTVTTPSGTSVPQHSSKGPNLVVILAAVLGGLALLSAAAAVAYILLRRKHTQPHPGPGRFRHKHVSSDTSAQISFLRPNLNNTEDVWTADYPTRDSFNDRLHTHNHSTDSVATVRPGLDEKFSVPPIAPQQTSSFMSESSERHALPPLIIPASSISTNPSIRDSVYAADVSSVASDSSESLYSQPSASSHRPTSVMLLPAMVPRYHQPNEAESGATTPQRSDSTRLVGRLLKERARRNRNQIERSASHIERSGSIRASGDDGLEGEDMESVEHGPPTTRRKSMKRAPTPLVSVAEGSESAASPTSASRP